MPKAKTRTITRYRSKKGGRHNRKFTLPIAIVAGFIPGVTKTIAGFQTGGLQGGARVAGNIYLGYDMDTAKFNFALMRHGLGPVILGTIVHKVAGILGVNRAIARAGIPILRF